MRHPHYQKPAISRRDMLRTCGCGFGGLALSSLLQRDLLAAQANPLAPRAPHFAPRAKRVIFLHMHGGPSQHDLFERSASTSRAFLKQPRGGPDHSEPPLEAVRRWSRLRTRSSR